jgi:hypothetical protein
LSIAIASLILLAVVAVVAVPVFGRVVGVATRRNENRPGGGEGGAQRQPSGEEIHEEGEALKRFGPLVGGGAAVTGILMGLVGAILATGIAGDASYLNTIPLASLGAFLGIIAYIMGAERFGKSAIVFAMVAMMFGVGASQGYVPGLEPTDRGLPAIEPGAPAGAVD